MKRYADGGYALGQPMGTVRGLRYGEGVEANDERSILKAKPRRMPNFDKWIGQAYSRGSVGPSKKRVDSALAFAISEYQFFAGEEYNPKGLVEVVKEVLYDVDQMVDEGGEDIMLSFPARQVEKEFWGWFKAVYPEDSEGFKAATKTAKTYRPDFRRYQRANGYECPFCGSDNIEEAQEEWRGKACYNCGSAWRHKLEITGIEVLTQPNTAPAALREQPKSGSPMSKSASKTGEDMIDPAKGELAKTWFNTEDPEEGVEDSGAGGAAHLFFDNPNKRETREFAESGADSNDPDSSDGDKTPPTPTEIREDEAGGEAFSTLNRLVVETDHPIEDEMPEGYDDVEKSEKVLKQAGMPDPRYLAKGLLKVDPDPKYAGGMQCPFCGSDAVSYMTGRDEGLEIRGSQAHHSLQCYNCHSHWEEHFSLKLKKMDVRKYPSKVLQSKPVDASPVGRTKIWSVGKSAASSLLDEQWFGKTASDDPQKFIEEVVRILAGKKLLPRVLKNVSAKLKLTKRFRPDVARFSLVSDPRLTVQIQVHTDTGHVSFGVNHETLKNRWGGQEDVVDRTTPKAFAEIIHIAMDEVLLEVPMADPIWKTAGSRVVQKILKMTPEERLADPKLSQIDFYNAQMDSHVEALVGQFQAQIAKTINAKAQKLKGKLLYTDTLTGEVKPRPHSSAQGLLEGVIPKLTKRLEDMV